MAINGILWNAYLKIYILNFCLEQKILNFFREDTRQLNLLEGNFSYILQAESTFKVKLAFEYLLKLVGEGGKTTSHCSTCLCVVWRWQVNMRTPKSNFCQTSSITAQILALICWVSFCLNIYKLTIII